ncbi:hypothetical protein DFH09DRAFT_844567, partial [Mycena vulgaris]
GGEDWGHCMEGLLVFEEAWGFPGKGLLSAPNERDKTARPREIPDFMRAARNWELPIALTSEIGPRESEGAFADLWWRWWVKAQPPSRVNEDGAWASAKTLDGEEWGEMAKMHGRNGMLLYMGALLW